MAIVVVPRGRCADIVVVGSGGLDLRVDVGSSPVSVSSWKLKTANLLVHRERAFATLLGWLTLELTLTVFCRLI